MYDEVLGLCVPMKVMLIGCAEDLTVIIVAEYRENVELYGSENVYPIKEWLRMVKLDPPDEEVKAVLITNRRKNTIFEIWIANHEVILKLIV